MKDCDRGWSEWKKSIKCNIFNEKWLIFRFEWAFWRAKKRVLLIIVCHGSLAESIYSESLAMLAHWATVENHLMGREPPVH